MIQKSLHKATLLLSLLLCSFVSAKSSDRVTRASTGPSCGSGDALNIGIYAASADTYSIQDGLDNDGNPTGTDIVLYCLIAKILGKSINFIQVASTGDGLAKLDDGTIDAFGGSELGITNARLANHIFVATDTRNNSFLTSQALTFAQTTPIADSIQGVLAINPNAIFGSQGVGSVQYQTLIEAGVPASQIVDVSNVPFNTPQQEQTYMIANNITAVYNGDCAAQAQFIATQPGYLSYVCVDLASDVQISGVGIAFNINCCDLAIQFQQAINLIVSSGAWADINHNLLQTPYYQEGIAAAGGLANFAGGTGIPQSDFAFWIPQPYPNYSFEAITDGGGSFFPLSCNLPASTSASTNALVNAIKAKYCNASCNYTFTPLPS